MDKGSAEEEKIDAILNSSVSSCSLRLQQCQETVHRVALSLYSHGLDGIAVSQACGSLDKGLLWAYRAKALVSTAEVTPEM